MDSNRLAGPRTFGVTNGGGQQHSRSSRRSANVDDEYETNIPSSSCDRLLMPSASVHTVPVKMAVPNTGDPNVVMPGRLEQPANTFSMIFRRKYERLDWRKLAAIDLEKIYKTQDTKTLQENLTQMAFFDLEEELRGVDIKPQFTKLFQLMQLSLEYLLYVQDHLQRELDSGRASYVSAIKQKEQEVGQLGEEVNNLKCSLQSSRDELKKRKKMMIAQQEIINSAAKGNYHRCPLCEKAFIERGFLETHFRKRHPNDDWSLLGGNASSSHAPPFREISELESARERVRELETLLATANQQIPIVIPPHPSYPVHQPPPEVPPQVLDLYNRQQENVENLRKALSEVQSRYTDSEKALADLRRDYENLSGKLQQNESPREVAEVFERRVEKLQENFETRLGKSEDSWKDRFLEAAEQHKRDLNDINQRTGEQQMSHKAEKLQLQMANEELLKRIHDLEKQLRTPKARPRKDPAFQVKVQTNQPQSSSGKTSTNRWGQTLTPRVSAAMTAHPSMINELRNELSEALSKKLEEYGVPAGCTRVSDVEKDQVFQRLREEHGQLQGKLAKFGAARSTIENHMRNRLPSQYSSSDLLDEASKIRVRTRTGRQVTETGPGGSQRVTEVTTYDIRPARSSELDVESPRDPDSREVQRPRTAPGSRRVTFERSESEFDFSPRGPFRTPTRTDMTSSSAETRKSDERPNLATGRQSPSSGGRTGKKQDDGAWFTDEDE